MEITEKSSRSHVVESGPNCGSKVTLSGLFEVKVEGTGLDMDLPVYVVSFDEPHAESTRARGTYTIHPCDEDIYLSSNACRAMTKVMISDELALAEKDHDLVIAVDELPPAFNAIIFSEPSEYFAPGYISEFEDFYNYAVFADKYALNFKAIRTKMDRIMWLIGIKHRQKILWRSGMAILTPVEGGEFNEPKFEPGQALAANPFGNYPAARAAVASVATTLKEVPRGHICPRKMESLFQILMIHGARDLVAEILVSLGTSIQHNHVIFGSPGILSMVKMAPPLRSVAFYAFRIMFLEEIALFKGKRNVAPTISLEAVSRLPTYKEGISPYICTLVKSPSMALSLPSYLEGARGAYSMAEFLQRLNKYTGGVLKYVKWKTDRSCSAITGSTMLACAARNPLEQGSFEEYLNEYYPQRTAQKMEVKMDDEWDDEKNDSLFDGETKDDPVWKGARLKTAPRMRWRRRRHRGPAPAPVANSVTPTEVEAKYSDIDLMIECAWEDFDEIAKMHFDTIQQAAREQNIECKLIEIITERRHKYSIVGLPRDIDMFQVESIPRVISKFHLGAVRLWYDGEQVHCLPSFVTACMTGMNVDIRWTSNQKDPREIILRYFQRGYGTLITRADKAAIIDYANANETRWPTIGPGPHADHWDATRYWEHPLFHDRIGEMFNPSASRCGIHSGLNTSRCWVAAFHLDTHKNDRAAPFIGKKGAAVSPYICEDTAKYL